MKIKILTFVSIISISVLLISWSGTAHDFINSKVFVSYNPMMNSFYSWAEVLAEHAGDADDRKSSDYTESPKHYINIDLYDDFQIDGIINQLYDDAINSYGLTFMTETGTLPWATLAAYDSVKKCFLRKDFDKAVLFAADMGHYVADGHMPLHLTSNYNGQNTGNTGIHSNYETYMLYLYLGQISYTGDSVKIIENVNNYVFNYIYYNYTFIDSIFAADNYAKTISSNTYSTAYKQALWEKTGTLTIELFKNASHALSELIYNAWVEAGSPELPTSVVLIENQDYKTKINNFPNPFKYSTKIEFSLFEDSNVSIQIFDAQGRIIETLLDKEFKRKGEYNFEWQNQGFSKGNYYLILHTDDSRTIKKIVLN